MCSNCLGGAEVIASQLAVAGYIVKGSVHRALARAGIVDVLDPVARDRVTVDFLRALELDPVELLGAETVGAADAWVPVPRQRPCRSANRDCARPIGSQSLVTAQ